MTMDERSLNVKEHQLKPETLNYFRKLDEYIDPKSDEIHIENEAHLNSLLNNIFTESSGQEEAMLLNKHTSFTLQKAFKISNDFAKLKSFLNSILTRIFALSQGRNSSHPIQALLSRLPDILKNELENGTKKSVKKLTKSLKKLFSSFEQNFFALSESQYGTFVARDLLRLSSDFFRWLKAAKQKLEISAKPRGKGAKTKKKRSKDAKRSEKAKNPLLAKLFKKVVERDSAGFETMVSDRHQSPVLKALVSEYGRERLPQKAFDKMVQRVIGLDVGMVQICKDQVGSFLVEVVIENSTEKNFALILTQIQPSLVELSLHPCGHHVVEKLATHPDLAEKDFTAVLSVLVPKLDFLRTHNKSVITALCRKAACFWSTQKTVLNALKSVLGAEEPEGASDCFAFLCKLIFSFDQNEDESRPGGGNNPFSPTGCAILQLVLGYHYSLTKPLFFSFRKLKDKSLVLKMALDPSASRVLTSLLSANLPKTKGTTLIKTKLVSQLKGSSVLLACHKYGSYVLECALVYGSRKQRLGIGKALAGSLYKLVGSKTGAIVVKKYRVEEFKRGENEWCAGIEAFRKELVPAVNK